MSRSLAKVRSSSEQKCGEDWMQTPLDSDLARGLEQRASRSFSTCLRNRRSAGKTPSQQTARRPTDGVVILVSIILDTTTCSCKVNTGGTYFRSWLHTCRGSGPCHQQASAKQMLHPLPAGSSSASGSFPGPSSSSRPRIEGRCDFGRLLCAAWLSRGRFSRASAVVSAARSRSSNSAWNSPL